jgi:iron complex outermembrane receptor protein
MAISCVKILLASVCAAAFAGHASAQPAAPTQSPAQNNPVAGKLTDQASNEPAQVTEVVVTAQKRVERVQDIPVAVTVVGGDQLARQNIQQVSDLSKAAPSLEVQNVPGQGGGPAIRGIGTESNSITAENSVAVVLDNVVLGRQPLNDLFDVSRVEVLRGPQGMLFGKNASAGVLNITTNAPDPTHFEAIGHADIGTSLGYGVYQGVLNIPLSDTAALRIAGHINTESGIAHNLVTGRDSSNDDAGIRARLLWQPNDALTINIIADYDRNKISDEFIQFDSLGATATGLSGVLAACGVTASRNNRDFCSNGPTDFVNTTYGISTQIDYRLGDYTLTSITAHRQSPQQNIQDIDVTPVDLLQNNAKYYTGVTSEEFRITSPSRQRFEYVVGAYVSNTDIKEYSAGIGTAPLIAFGPQVVVPPIDTVNLGHAQLNSVAIFGQGTLHITDQLRAIIGARESHDDVLAQNTDEVALASTTGAVSRTDFSYKAGLQYDVSRELMFYTTYSRGYKGPSVNLPTTSLPGSFVTPEIPVAYEAGVKGTVLNGRLAVDLNGFYTTIHDYQTQILVNSAVGPQFIVGNVPFVRTRGVELDLFGKPFPGLTINGGLTYDVATYGPYTAQNISLDYVSVRGDQIAFTPKWKGTLSAEYAHPITSRFNGFVQADIVYKSKINYDAAPDAGTTIGDQELLGARAGVRSPDGRWSVSVFARNLLDQRVPANLQVGPLENFSGGVGGGVPSVAHVLSLDSFRLVGFTLDGRF